MFNMKREYRRMLKAEQSVVAQRLNSLAAQEPEVRLAPVNLAVAHQLRDKDERIKTALGRLTRGSFGKCERCGTQIESERLRTLPYTTLCANCSSVDIKRNWGRGRP